MKNIVTISSDFKHWYGLDVVAARGLKNSLLLFRPETHEQIMEKLAIGQGKGIAEYMRASVVGCQITSEGRLLLPDYLLSFLRTDGLVRVKEESGMLILDRGPGVKRYKALKEAVIAALKEAKEGNLLLAAGFVFLLIFLQAIGFLPHNDPDNDPLNPCDSGYAC